MGDFKWTAFISSLHVWLHGLPSGLFYLAKNIGHVVEFYCQYAVPWPAVGRSQKIPRTGEVNFILCIMPAHSPGIVLTTKIAFFVMLQIMSNVG